MFEKILQRKFFILLLIIMIISTFIISLFIANFSEKAESCVLPDSAILSDNLEVLPDYSGNFLILSAFENISHVTYFDGKNQIIGSTNLELDYKYSAVTIFGDYFYIAKCVNNSGTYTTDITKYSFSSGCFTSITQVSLPSKKVENNHSLAAAKNDFIFLINENDRSKIIAYNVLTDDSSQLTYSSKQFASISTNLSGTKLYAITTDKTFISFDVDSSFSQNLLANSPDDHCAFLNDNLLVSSTNKVYSISDTTVSNLFSINNEGTYNSSCLFEDYLLGQVSDSTIYCYDIETKTATKQINVTGKILALSTSDNITIAILKNGTEKSVKIINSTDLSDIDTSDPGDDKPIFNISSALYTINFEAKTISDVPLSTTIATFKSNIENPDNYSLSFINYLGKSFSSGALGTGSRVTFVNSTGESISFKIIINGDITGEGNKNSRDIDFLYNHLFGKSSLLDEYLNAADINGDGKINTIDLLLMYKSIRS